MAESRLVAEASRPWFAILIRLLMLSSPPLCPAQPICPTHARPSCAKLKANEDDRTRRGVIDESLMKEIVVFARNMPGDTVFGSIDRIGKMFDKVIARAGIAKRDELGRKLVAHSFRHTYSTRTTGVLGGNPFVVQAALGHAQISTIQRYRHASTPEVQFDISVLMGGQKGWKEIEKDKKLTAQVS